MKRTSVWLVVCDQSIAYGVNFSPIVYQFLKVMKSLFFVTLKLLHWVKDRTSETEEKKHVIGENLTEAEALSADLQELEARLKVCFT